MLSSSWNRRAGLAPKVKTLSGQVKAMVASDADNGGVRLPLNTSAQWGRREGATMNDIARQLRAQIPASTDPHRLERLASEAEHRASLRDINCTGPVDTRVFQHVEQPTAARR
jgi:hypothetical protein